MGTNRLPSAHQTNSWENWPDGEILEELHYHRAELAQRFDYSLEHLYEYYSSVLIEPEIPRLDMQQERAKRSKT